MIRRGPDIAVPAAVRPLSFDQAPGELVRSWVVTQPKAAANEQEVAFHRGMGARTAGDDWNGQPRVEDPGQRSLEPGVGLPVIPGDAELHEG